MKIERICHAEGVKRHVWMDTKECRKWLMGDLARIYAVLHVNGSAHKVYYCITGFQKKGDYMVGHGFWSPDFKEGAYHTCQDENEELVSAVWDVTARLLKRLKLL